MSKGDRVRLQHQNGAMRILNDQKEELIRQLALERTNHQSATLVMACLVKRLGAVLPNDKGWRVLVTDEEVEAIDGELEVHRSEGAMGLVLTLKAKPLQEEPSGTVEEDQGELHLDPAEATLQGAVQEQGPVEES